MLAFDRITALFEENEQESPYPVAAADAGEEREGVVGSARRTPGHSTSSHPVHKDLLLDGR